MAGRSLPRTKLTSCYTEKVMSDMLDVMAKVHPLHAEYLDEHGEPFTRRRYNANTGSGSVLCLARPNAAATVIRGLHTA